MLNAMLLELQMRWEKWPYQNVKSLYVGGGTPSLLPSEEWAHFCEGLFRIVGNQPIQEFTIEVNPEDMESSRIEKWVQYGVNRLSIGIQSLEDRDLQHMNRAHSAKQARESIEIAQQHGLQNISIDLIYGTPWKNLSSWEAELKWVLDMHIPHLSAYALTVEEKTALHKHIVSGKTSAPDDSQAQIQFFSLSHWAQQNSWDHYEISNLSRPGFRAIHNSQYWNGTPYLGIGPSAHSFDGQFRSWNVANNQQYILQAEQTSVWESDSESLSLVNKINETIMTKLRLSEGLNIQDIDSLYPGWLKTNRLFLEEQQKLNHLHVDETRVVLSPKGRFLSDFIITELLVSEL